jgi:hypothetical protein
MLMLVSFKTLAVSSLSQYNSSLLFMGGSSFAEYDSSITFLVNSVKTLFQRGGLF